MIPSRRCALRPEPLQQQPEERAGGLRVDNGVPTTGPVRGEVCHVYLPPATQLYYVNNTVMVSAKQTISVSRLQQWRMEDKKPNEPDEFVGSDEEKMFQSLLREMEDRKKSYLGIRVNPSSRQPARAQCGVMRAAATHITSQAKHTRAVLLCRMQTTDCSSPGSERGPARIQGRGRSPRRLPTRSPRRSSRAASGAPVIRT